MYGATIGKLGILTFPATTNQACCACVKYFGIFPMYLFYFLLSQRNEFISKGGGGAQPNISKEIIISTDIPLPPIEEQKRIVSEIMRLSKHIEEIEKGQTILSDKVRHIKSKILDLAIHGKLVPQNPDDEPAAELLRRVNPKARIITDNPHYPQLPDNWVLTKVESLAELLSGRDLDISDCNDNGKGLPYLIGASNIVYGAFKITRWTETPQVISTHGDVLISCKGTIGEMVLNTVGNVHIARQFMAIRPNQAINREFLYYALESVLDAIKKKANGIIPGISRPVILSQNIALPPMEEQRRIVFYIKKYFYCLSKITSIL